MISELSKPAKPAKTDLGANRQLQLMAVIYVVVWIWMAIAPLDRMDWLLENLLVFVSVGALALTYRSFPLSNLAYLLITVFLILHTIGSHYTYEHVPLGYWIKEAMGLKRNHFDRIVHFSFGLLLFYPLREGLLRVIKTTTFWGHLLTISIVMAASGLFEKLEMAVAMLVSPELGSAYLGTQGDVWDAQKDMTLAMFGAILASLVFAVLEKRTRRSR